MIRANTGKLKSRDSRRRRRHHRIRQKVQGTGSTPRLVVNRSLKHISGQIVDDEGQTTLVAFSTVGADLGSLDTEKEGAKSAQARVAGKRLAEKAKEKGIETVVFDRGGYRYHGRVQAFAEGARDGGLKF